MGLEFDERRVKRTQEDQAMNPIVRTHTKEDMSAAKEGKQEDTMCKETNCCRALYSSRLVIQVSEAF